MEGARHYTGHSEAGRIRAPVPTTQWFRGDCKACQDKKWGAKSTALSTFYRGKGKMGAKWTTTESEGIA